MECAIKAGAKGAMNGEHVGVQWCELCMQGYRWETYIDSSGRRHVIVRVQGPELLYPNVCIEDMSGFTLDVHQAVDISGDVIPPVADNAS